MMRSKFAAQIATALAFAGCACLAFVGGGLLLRGEGLASIAVGLTLIGAAIFDYRVYRSPEPLLRVGALSMNILLLIITSSLADPADHNVTLFVRMVWLGVALASAALLLYRADSSPVA